jgi:hypothetical protein
VKRCKHEPYATHNDRFKCCICKREVSVTECDTCHGYSAVWGKCHRCGNKGFTVKLKGRK